MYLPLDNARVPMKHIDEIVRVCNELGIDCKVVPPDEARKYNDFIVKKFNVQKQSGHLSILYQSISVPIEKWEFLYSEFLKDEPVYVFFDQENFHSTELVVIEKGKFLGRIMEDSYGMEYFASNIKGDYLLAVNWYVIEGAGTSIEWLTKLNTVQPGHS